MASYLGRLSSLLADLKRVPAAPAAKMATPPHPFAESGLSKAGAGARCKRCRKGRGHENHRQRV